MRNGDLLTCPDCDAQVNVYSWGWNCTGCELDSEKYAQVLLMAADVMAHGLRESA